jgi:hypothetical protein
MTVGPPRPAEHVSIPRPLPSHLHARASRCAPVAGRVRAGSPPQAQLLPCGVRVPRPVLPALLSAHARAVWTRFCGKPRPRAAWSSCTCGPRRTTIRRTLKAPFSARRTWPASSTRTSPAGMLLCGDAPTRGMATRGLISRDAGPDPSTTQTAPWRPCGWASRPTPLSAWSAISLRRARQQSGYTRSWLALAHSAAHQHVPGSTQRNRQIELDPHVVWGHSGDDIEVPGRSGGRGAPTRALVLQGDALIAQLLEVVEGFRHVVHREMQRHAQVRGLPPRPTNPRAHSRTRPTDARGSNRARRSGLRIPRGTAAGPVRAALVPRSSRRDLTDDARAHALREMRRQAEEKKREEEQRQLEEQRAVRALGTCSVRSSPVSPRPRSWTRSGGRQRRRPRARRSALRDEPRCALRCRPSQVRVRACVSALRRPV